MRCFECGAMADHHHHVVPKVKGGSNTVPLCESCHSKVHGKNMLNHRELTRIGLQKAVREGRMLGSKPMIKEDTEELILNLRASGMGMIAIAKELNSRNVPTAKGGSWHGSTVRVVLQRRKVN